MNPERRRDQALQLLIEFVCLGSRLADKDADARKDLQGIGRAAILFHAALDAGIGIEAMLLRAARAAQGVGMTCGQLHARARLTRHEHDRAALYGARDVPRPLDVAVLTPMMY